MRELASAILLMATLLVAASPARADEPTPSEVAAARQLFQEGLALARDGQWEDARDAFSRSYALAPRPSTLLNLAGAQRETERLVESVETYRRFLREAGEQEEQFRSSAEEAILDLETRVGRLVISIDEMREGDVVRLDDVPLSAAALGVTLPVDPGAHVVTVVRGGVEAGGQELELAEGEERTITVLVNDLGPEPNPLTTTVADPNDPDDASGSLLESPWLWIGVGAAVVLGATIAIVAAAGSPSSPYVGNFGAGMVTFD